MHSFNGSQEIKNWLRDKTHHNISTEQCKELDFLKRARTKQFNACFLLGNIYDTIHLS
jgi:hypothetical protein